MVPTLGSSKSRGICSNVRWLDARESMQRTGPARPGQFGFRPLGGKTPCFANHQHIFRLIHRSEGRGILTTEGTEGHGKESGRSHRSLLGNYLNFPK